MVNPVDKYPKSAGYSESLMHDGPMRQSSSDLRGLSSQQMNMIGPVITSSSLDGSGNEASENYKKLKAQPWKNNHLDNASKVSDSVISCASVNSDPFNAVQCPHKDSQLNIAKDVQFGSTEHSTMHIKDTFFPALEDIVPTGWESTDSVLPEAGCSEMNSSCSDLSGNAEIPVPHDSSCRSFAARLSNSNMVGAGILKSNSGHTRSKSQVKNNRSRWSRNRMISNVYRKPWLDDIREFGKARRDQIYASKSCVISSSVPPRKSFKNESRQYQISALNPRLPVQTYRAKPLGQENSNFIWRRIATRMEKCETHARRGFYQNHSVAETRGMSLLSSNQLSLSQHKPSSKFPHAVQGIPDQIGDKFGYSVGQGIYGSCGQEAAAMWSFDQGFGMSGVQCLSIPVQSPATGCLAWEGWTIGMYQPYSLEASQYLATPEWDSDSAIDLSVAQQGDSQCNYGHGFFSSGMYHCGFMPKYASPQNILQPAQSSFVPCNYHGAMFLTEPIINGADVASNTAIKGHCVPDEGQDSDASSSVEAKSNKTNVFTGCDATSSTAERETGCKIDVNHSDMTDNMRYSESPKNSDGNNNNLEKAFEKDQAALLAHCTAPCNQFTYLCSQKTAEALAASWKSQVASESILEATGSPIAQFERLLYDFAPVIASSPYKSPEGSPCNKSRSSLLSKRLWPDVSLLDVWKWYIQCASFGLGVQVEDSWNSDSFCAYFAPSLSALQLFRHSQNSLSDSLKKLSVEANTEKCLGSPSSLDLKQPKEPSDSDVSSLLYQNDSAKDLNDNSSASPFCFSDDAEVIFEYFEHDQPQNRKPLHETIIEIIEQGSSNPHSFGDPSKLDQLKLCDLHPASWYSVAWYPISRIPENTRTGIPPLRASFLTYHSLSQLVIRHEIPDREGNSTFCIVPAVGMCKYNGNNECWFRRMEFAGPISINGVASDSSKVLEERLRALEEVAAVFSDGHILKNGVTSSNRHSDYDFFIRRT